MPLSAVAGVWYGAHRDCQMTSPRAAGPASPPPVGPAEPIAERRAAPPATPVEVTNAAPLSVTVEPPPDTPAHTEAKVVAASAAVDADVLRTADQRRISGMWERTQQVIALSVVEGTLGVIALVVAAPAMAIIGGNSVPDFIITAAIGGMIFLTSVANLVIGFYFGRTNHQRVGGVGSDNVAGR